MNTIRLETVSYDDCTLGRLWCGDVQCFTLELPWHNNLPNISCIPPGQYSYFRRTSPSNGEVLELRDVEGRTFIQIHAGNYTRHTFGCILVGDAVKFLDGDDVPDVTNSRSTLGRLLAVAGAEGLITVVRA